MNVARPAPQDDAVYATDAHPQTFGELPTTATLEIEKYTLQQATLAGAADRRQLGITLSR